MENKSSNNLSKKEIEALIPDYIFGNLTHEQRSDFEISIVNYPDLEFEVEEGISLFSRIDKMDFEKILEQKTGYLPEKVVARLEKNNKPVYNLRVKPKRWLLPVGLAVAAAVLLFFFINTTQHKTVKTSFSYSSNNLEQATVPINDTSKSIFTDLEKIMLYEEFVETGNIDDIKDYIYDYYDGDIFEENIDEIYYSTLENNFEEFLDNSSLIYASSDINQRMFVEELAELNEENFTNLIEGILK